MVCLLTGRAWADSPSPGNHIQVVASSSKTRLPTKGPKLAPVTIEAFINLANPRSFQFLHILDELSKRHPKRLKILYRLTEKLETSNNLAQLFGLEAWHQGQFFPFLDAFYEGRRRPPSYKDFPKVAEKAGVNFQTIHSSVTGNPELLANHFYWLRMGVLQLPGMLVNGKVTRISNDLESMEDIYDTAYAESIRLLDRGVSREDLARVLQREARKANLKRNEIHLQGHVGSLDLAPDEDPPTGPVAIAMGALLQGSHRRGINSASVKAAFLCHLQSSLCRFTFDNLVRLQHIYPDDFQFVFLPLFSTDRPNQENTEQMYHAVLCADEQKSYWDYVEAIYNRGVRYNFDLDYALELATSLGLEGKSFARCMETNAYEKQVKAELSIAQKAGITQTPAVAIGGVLYPGRLYLNELRLIVESLRAPGILESLSQPK